VRTINNLEFSKWLFEQLCQGNGSVVTSDNIYKLNQIAIEVYNVENLNENQVEILKNIILSCNILYNRTDMQVLPIEDGFYDLLLEKYKIYDSNFQVGSYIVDFKNFIENHPDKGMKIATCPVIFEKHEPKDELHEDVFNDIMRKGKPILNIHDFATCPVEFESERITKRTHDTELAHPSLVGTLDKCKFVLNKDAIDAGAFDDPNVKIFERDFIQAHINKGIINPNQRIEVVCELKYDGISVDGNCDLFVESANTRGDTGIGVAADITPILKGYPFKQAKCMIGEDPIGVKFEAIITKSDLDTFNKLRGRSYSNCRTAIIGLFGASDAYMFRDLITLVPLALDRDQCKFISNRKEEIAFLNKVFVSHGEPLRYCYFEGTVSEILYYVKAFHDEAMVARDYLNFLYDGIVVSYLDEDIRNKLGRENFINKYSIAIKFDPEEKQTIFRGYTFEVGQHGQITPMIHYDPVEFRGTIHTKSTGSSYNRFVEMGLRYGDYINVTYRNDVMPYVSTVDCDSNRKNPNPVIEFPKVCPVCGAPLIISDSGKSAICPNIECDGRSIGRMVNMFAKLNIKGFADSAFRELSVYHLHSLMCLGEINFVKKLGNADGKAFYQSLVALRSNPLKDYIIMGSLGFTSLAHKKWKDLLEKITVRELYELYLSCRSGEEFREKLLSIGASDSVATTISTEFPFFEKDIIEILRWNNLVDTKNNSSNSIDFHIRFSGVRNKQLSELLCKVGYDADDNSAVGKNTDILLVPYDGFTSSKVNKARSIPKCKIVPIQEFIDNMESYIGMRITTF
jgi:NAD-dependent DNA ligase